MEFLYEKFDLKTGRKGTQRTQTEKTVSLRSFAFFCGKKIGIMPLPGGMAECSGTGILPVRWPAGVNYFRNSQARCLCHHRLRAKMFFIAERIVLSLVKVEPIDMSRSNKTFFALTASAVFFCALIFWGCASAMENPPPAQQSANDIPDTTNAVPARLEPGPNDPRIAYVTARLLVESHYSQLPFDAEMSAKFFDAYLESLDPSREDFLQSDLDEFAHYRTNLDALTIGGRGKADLTPAYDIFQRFLERLQQHVAYVDDLLKEDKFSFTGDDRILIDRRHAPYPKDLDDAKQIWRDQLRYQYLQEKLSRETQSANAATNSTVKISATNDIAATLARHYKWNFSIFSKWDSTDVLQYYLDALMHAYDPHSDYLNNAHAADFSIQMNLSLFGIGAQLTEDDGYCTIASLLPGGPAAKSKQLKEKDRIVAVAQGSNPPVDVVDMELSKVVQLIRGPKGTEVRLTISRADDGAARRVLPPLSLTRDEIKMEDSEAKAQLIELPDGKGGTNRLGVINVPGFYAPTDLSGRPDQPTPKFISADTAKLIKKLEDENVAGIIIDLRNNGGGSLEEAIKFTGLFITNGPVVLVRDGDGRVQTDVADSTNQLYSGPLAVLVNHSSASASEIAAAALQDYGRALIVGDTSTFGKGTVQQLMPLRPFVLSATSDPGTAKITIRKFYRISGGSTQFKGVIPDIILPDKLSYWPDLGEGSLDNPLPWDTIPSANYDSLNLVQPYLGEIAARSGTRIATNRDFVFIRQDIDEFRKLLADKTASLNEQEQLKQFHQNQSRQKAYEAERDARKFPDEKIYDITVENADQPGLPPPVGETNLLSSADLKDVDAAFTNAQKSLGAATTVSTNETSAASAKIPPPPDPMLDETEHILEDYISLLKANNSVVAHVVAQ
jgi:carboxyl-terminal processing protease